MSNQQKGSTVEIKQGWSSAGFQLRINQIKSW